MAKIPIYELYYPKDKELADVIRALGEAKNTILRKRAESIESEILRLSDNQKKIELIRYFTYWYLLFYEYFGLPVKPNSDFLLLQNSYEQLERKYNILETKHKNLLSQTTNAFSGEDIKKLREEDERLKETIQDEKTQRTSAQDAYEELKQKYENATETLSKLKEIEDKYNELIETEKANQKKLDEAEKSKKAISDYATELLKEKESLEAELEGFKNLKQNKGIAKAFNAKKETETLKKERDKLQQDYDEIREQYEKAFRSSQDFVGSITALEERINTLKQQLNEEKAKSKQLEDKLFEKEEELRQQKIVLFNAGNPRSDRYSESLDERIKEKDREIRKLKKQIELNAQLQNSDKSPDYSKELDSLQQQHEEALNQLREENKELKEKFEELNSKYVELLMKSAM